MINSVTLAGNVTREPEIKHTGSGMAVVKISLAVNERRKNNQTGEWENYPNYFDCVCFGDRFEKIAPYMGKGAKVTVQGKLRYSTWEKDGQKRSKVDVIVDDVELPPRNTQQPQQPQQSMDVYDDDLPF